jgi:hypothetical protein
MNQARTRSVVIFKFQSPNTRDSFSVLRVEDAFDFSNEEILIKLQGLKEKLKSKFPHIQVIDDADGRNATQEVDGIHLEIGEGERSFEVFGFESDNRKRSAEIVKWVKENIAPHLDNDSSKFEINVALSTDDNEPLRG